jgi:hypothetical protein
MWCWNPVIKIFAYYCLFSLLNTIASYSDAKNKKSLDVFTNWADLIFYKFYLGSKLDSDEDQDSRLEFITTGERNLEEFCNAVNSIRFELNKKGLPITIPKKITLVKNLNLGNITNM